MLESFLLVVSLCVDALVAGFAYGANKIKIPFLSGTVLTCISTLFLIISLSLGALIKDMIPMGLAPFICFAILIFLGVGRLFEGLIKGFLTKTASSPHDIEFTLFDFKLIFNVYADATLADVDHSKVLSTKESIYLGIALSLDSLAVGFGAGFTAVHFYEVVLLSLILNALALLIGGFLGKRFADKLYTDLSWVSGIILILLAVLKLY
ncbi:MAG: sporulation rane protein YtaF [Clostridia bacterium]|jgi:putative sporulation protein YtaF|nr:sporulation rane protein YtaF [Clostridia bacterium]